MSVIIVWSIMHIVKLGCQLIHRSNTSSTMLLRTISYFSTDSAARGSNFLSDIKRTAVCKQ